MKIIETKDIDIDKLDKNPFQARFDRKQGRKRDGFQNEENRRFLYV